MLILPFLLNFLKANWKWIAIGIVILSIFTYIKVLKHERDSARAELVQVTAQFKEYRTNAEAMQTALKSSNAALTLRYKSTLIEQWKAIEVGVKANAERIRADEELRAIKLSVHAVSVFNASTESPDQIGSTPPTVSGDDGGTTATLADLIATAAENSAKHWQCIKQVKAWQGFWTEFENGVRAAGG